MPSGKVRADYDQLKVISNMFNSQAQGCQAKNQRLKSDIETLRGGDWQGDGAKSFYREMDSEVMPALNRLHNALSEAGRITAQLAQIMKAAEDEASSVFKF
jgi:WXG100 family type VII secretion target